MLDISAGSSVAGSLYVSLHTADPGVGGGQNTNEATYSGYARVAVAGGDKSPAVSWSADAYAQGDFAPPLGVPGGAAGFSAVQAQAGLPQLPVAEPGFVGFVPVEGCTPDRSTAAACATI